MRLLPHFPINCEKQKHHDLAAHPVIITAAVGSQKLVMDYSPELQGLQRRNAPPAGAVSAQRRRIDSRRYTLLCFGLQQDPGRAGRAQPAGGRRRSG